MYLAERLRQFRESKGLSQGDIEERTGLRRCYVSRVENGHTVPSIETLEEISRALETPLYQLFYEDESVPDALIRAKDVADDWASQGKGLRIFTKIHHAASRMNDDERALLLCLARRTTNGSRRKTP